MSSDISLLTARGVPSFAPNYDSREYFNYHHNAADTFDKVNPQGTGRKCRVDGSDCIWAFQFGEAPAKDRGVLNG